MEWTKQNIINQLEKIYDKGYLSIAAYSDRKDDGAIGQILEREFGIEENNVEAPDLGIIELKAKRSDKKGKLTLFHKTTEFGMTPIEIFDKYGYIKKSNRTGLPKKKLFTTIHGKTNKLGFRVAYDDGTQRINLYHKNDIISGWGSDIQLGWNKIQNMLVVIADTQGSVGAKNERFRYKKAYLCTGLKSIGDAFNNREIVVDFCVDTDIGSNRAPHDRGPHFRTTVKKLEQLYDKVEIIFERD